MKKFNFEKVSANLRSYRAKAGLRQKELAEAIGVHVQTISNYEHDSSQMSIKNLIKLADYFQIKPEDFFME